MTCSTPAVSLVVGPLARSSGGAPLWAVIVALAIVLLALYMLFGAQHLPFVRSGTAEEGRRPEDPADQPPVDA